MKNLDVRGALALIGAALALAFAPPAGAQARPTVVDQRFDGSLAVATFDSDARACVSTSISVSILDGRGASASTGTPILTVIVDEFNACSGTELGSVVSQLALSAGQFVIDNKLASASLAATVPFFDTASGRAMSLVLNLLWTATDKPLESRLISHSTGPGGTTQLIRATGTFSDAAVAGTPTYGDGDSPTFTLRTAQLGEGHDGTHIVFK